MKAKTYAAMKNISKIKQKLVGFGVQDIAKETKFHMRDSGKIDAESYIHTFRSFLRGDRQIDAK